MNTSFTKPKNSKAAEIVRQVLLSKFFPFVTMAVVILCYYLSLDIVTICYLGIAGILILLFLDDVSPIVTVMLFMNVIISWKNSPASGRGESDYFFRPEILAPLIIIVTLLIASLVYRLVITCVRKKFKLDPVFFGLCVFSVALLLNGAGNKNYTFFNLLYAVILALLFLGLFAVLKDNVTADRCSYERICYSFVAFGLLLIIELAVLYATKDAIFAGGTIDRNQIVFGWGVYTTYGALLTMCIPAAFYLAYAKKFGFVYTLISVIMLVALIFSCCRQAMVCAAVIYPVCTVMLLVKGNDKIANLCIFAASLIGVIVVTGLFQDKVIDFFKTIYSNIVVNGELYGSGRMELWRQAISDFKSFPVFGRGFYNIKPDTDFSYTPIPMDMAHNTILEMMSACGIIGLLGYALHRVQTFICFFKNPTTERSFIALIVASLLINSLLDNHILNIIPTMVYSLLIAVLVKGQSKNASR